MRKKKTLDLTRVEVARRLKVGRVTVERFVREGRLRASGTRGNAQTFDPEAVDALARELRREARTAGGPDRSAYLAARTRFQEARAASVELETRRRSGELVSAKDVEEGLTKMLIEVRTRLLAVPNGLRHLRPHLSRDDIHAVRSLIREALTELATPKKVAATEGDGA